MKNLTFSQAVGGFMLACDAEHLSPHTISDYAVSLRRFGAFLDGDPPLAEITADQVRTFLAGLRKPQPRDLGAVKNVPAKPLSGKTILNYHTGLASLWSWAVAEGITEHHVLRDVARPKAETPAIKALTQADMKALLAACDRSREYERPGKRGCDNARPTALRDRTILLLLLDTGLRASELTGIRAQDVDLRNRRVWVTGKGSRERLLPMSAETAKSLWRYMQEERSEAKVSAPLFVTIHGDPLTRTALLDLLGGLGQRAGVPDVHPHRFRHTFAITCLRNGMNALELQMALGHSSLEMVQTYVRLAQTDIESAHREASPVARWRLK